MKKLLAILLLTIYLFNLTGYSLLFQYLINDTDTVLVKRLDKDAYNDKDLIEVKVALNMPYLTTSKNFERVNGQLELNGVHYNYVKRKVSSDTLYLLCLPNFAKTQLYAAKAGYANECNDVPSGKKNTESSTAKKSGAVNEYNCVTTQFNFSPESLLPGAFSGFICAEITPAFIKSPAQPPDFHC